MVANGGGGRSRQGLGSRRRQGIARAIRHAARAKTEDDDEQRHDEATEGIKAAQVVPATTSTSHIVERVLNEASEAFDNALLSPKKDDAALSEAETIVVNQCGGASPNREAHTPERASAGRKSPVPTSKLEDALPEWLPPLPAPAPLPQLPPHQISCRGS